MIENWVTSTESLRSTAVINITFDRFDLEHGGNCEFDFLQINDGPNAGSRVIDRFCGDGMQSKSLVSTHNHVYLWFQSDKTVAQTGFFLRWTAMDPFCGGLLNTSEYGSVNSPGYPGKYPVNRTCEWMVRVPFGKRIQFHFATLQIESHDNCSYDYLKVSKLLQKELHRIFEPEVYDGPSSTDPVIGLYCTTVTPAPLTTSGHEARLLFHSDESVQDFGFHITYAAQPKVQGCGGILTTPSGTIRSPNFPDVYENNLNCEWLIRIHPDNRLMLTFKEFNLEHHQNCSFDYLEPSAFKIVDSWPVCHEFESSTAKDSHASASLYGTKCRGTDIR
ncbi:cubilin homolog [Trichonephila clavipes]|nr:cubilin homolog [Trichonephila clavipes]